MTESTRSSVPCDAKVAEAAGLDATTLSDARHRLGLAGHRCGIQSLQTVHHPSLPSRGQR